MKKKSKSSLSVKMFSILPKTCSVSILKQISGVMLRHALRASHLDGFILCHDF